MGQTPGRRAHRRGYLGLFPASRPDLAITGRSYWLKDHAAIAGKDD
jgi:hypothetical protein